VTETSPTLPISDVPLGGLPSADKTLLTKAPLEVAIIEVRFTSSMAEVPVEAAARIRDALAEAVAIDFPTIQPATQRAMQINFNAEGASWAGDQTTGWQVASGDGQHSATLFPGSVVWQVGDYKRWSLSMRAPLEVLLSAVETDLAPSLVQRIGLRYVDRFVDPSCKSLADWVGKIDTSVLGPLGNVVFGTKVRGAQQQVEVALDERHGALLRHGPIHDQASKTVNYLLDLDVFSHGASAFVVADVLTTAERLNRTALSLFQACVSTDYLKSLQGEVDDQEEEESE
jgi:uncharacterized protein (TIGR04255 family)